MISFHFHYLQVYLLTLFVWSEPHPSSTICQFCFWEVLFKIILYWMAMWSVIPFWYYLLNQKKEQNTEMLRNYILAVVRWCTNKFWAPIVPSIISCFLGEILRKKYRISAPIIGGFRGWRWTPPPGRPKSFDFMWFSGKFGKIVCWRPCWVSALLGEILDPPLPM